MDTIELIAIEGTAMAHDLHQRLPSDVCHTSLTPALTAPVFRAPPGHSLGEAVAITFRNEDGEAIHGGFYHLHPKGFVEKLVLIDTARDVNTDADPAWTAFGLSMMVGKLLVKEDAGTRELIWSVIDFGVNDLSADIRSPTPARHAVHAAYLEEILPTLDIHHGKASSLEP